ncbi:MAG: pseudouridine synthase, partial [Candidatus Binatia bacterium]
MTLKRARVSDKAVGRRLDLFATQQFSDAMERYGFSRSAVQRLISNGYVTLNGASAKPSARLKADDLVELACVFQQRANVAAEPIPLSILYEDEDCIVINKPPGMVVHPAAGNANGTLVNALLYHCPDLVSVGGESRPGIVHRLDKDTSGVMIVAKNEWSLQHLARQFKNRTVRKEYLALVWEKPEGKSGIIDRPVGRHRSQRKKMSSLHTLHKAREAVTEWRVERAFKLSTESKNIRWVT